MYDKLKIGRYVQNTRLLLSIPIIGLSIVESVGTEDFSRYDSIIIGEMSNYKLRNLLQLL